ncbi:amino acid adenylation domain-containing protein [Brevibacillus borstelensis]|uniref:amino acid adenylation domain-containing protein n=1 Tax=Brevibacillus borstelensis TaxID=45462 RepID=UPI0030C456A5
MSMVHTQSCLGVHHLFEQQASKSGDAIAVVHNESQLSYKELNERVNQLARYLVDQGAANTIVGLSMDRSIDMIISFLAIYKAGSAYLPIDPGYPKSRIDYLINDAQLPFVITHSKYADRFRGQNMTVICLDQIDEVLSGYSRGNPESVVAEKQMAYIMYTSGTTGNPKGVMISHENLINHHLAVIEEYELNTEDRVMQLSSMSFDISVEEIFPTLLSGATLVLWPDVFLQTDYTLTEWLYENRITVANLPTSLWHAWVDVLSSENASMLACLRLVVIGGEKASLKHYKKWREVSGNTKWINTYGPTETTIISTLYHEENEMNQLFIGRPIRNVHTYVFDEHVKPVSEGETGELYIGGAGVGLGYFNQPELTASKFIQHPTDKQERLYKTGDLVKVHPDGNLEFLGRLDHQVKLRGFRVELEEIESILQSHPSIQNAALFTKEQPNGMKKLVAAVVPVDREAFQLETVKTDIKQKLPDYMIPAAYLIVESLPLTTHGKIDRRKLLDLAGPSTEKADYQQPRTAIEKELVEIWKEVLRAESIGIYDNFFELGGDSILCFQMIAKSRQRKMIFTANQLFQNPTIATLAKVVKEDRVVSDQGVATGEVRLTPIQRWFFDQSLPNPHHWNMPMLVEVHPPVYLEWVKEALRHLVLHHDALRLRYEQTTSGWRQWYDPAQPEFPFQEENLAELSEDEQVSAMESIANQVQASLDLNKGPIARAVYFHRGPGKTDRLLIVVHHLVIDGVSWRILLEDFTTAYEQLEQGQPVQLLPKTSSFQEWANRLSAYAQTQELKKEWEYWKQESLVPVPALPVDHQTGDNTDGSAAKVTVSLTREETRALLQDVPKAYHTQINDILLTALAEAYVLWSGNERLRINLEGHGREEIIEGVDITRTVGWFTTVFPVLLEGTYQRPIQNGELLKAVKEKLRQIPKRGIGYGLMRYLQDDQEIAEILLSAEKPQITFNYLGQFDNVFQKEQLLTILSDQIGSEFDANGTRDHLLYMNGLIINEQLEIVFEYSQNVHNTSTILHFANSFLASIRDWIEHCIHLEQKRYTPSDFPTANLTQSELDQLLNMISAKEFDQIYGLTPLQQGLLFESRFESEPGMYMEHFCCDLQGDFNPTLWTKAWTAVFQKHPVLRSAFFWKEFDKPIQVVFKSTQLPVQVYDWRSLSDEEFQHEMELLLERDCKEGFSFEEPPLLRIAFLQQKDDFYKMIVCSHHIILDGWSLHLVLQDLFTSYKHLVNNQEFSLGPASNSFQDYMVWLQKQDYDQAELFWRQYVKGFEGANIINSELKPVASLSERYRDYKVRLSKEATDQLYLFAKENQVTMNTCVQGAWALCLSQFTSEPEVMFGTTVSVRPTELQDSEQMVGLLINTLPFRVSIRRDQTVMEWLLEIQMAFLEVREYDYVSLSEIPKWGRDSGSMSLFDSILVFQNMPVDLMEHGDQDLFAIVSTNSIERTSFPLSMAVEPGERLRIHMSYDGRHFDEETIARLVRYFQNALEETLTSPERALSEISILPEDEKQQMLARWNQTEKAYPLAKCVHEWVEEQALQIPQAVAVVDGHRALAYEELNQRANQLAHLLRTRGLAAGQVVGVYLERSLELIICQLAVFKAGGVYLPLDQSYSSERIEWILQDADLPFLLTKEDMAAAISVEDTVHTIWIDREEALLAQQPSTNPPEKVDAEQVAYIIYTSGPTGKPNGVLMPHKGLINLVSWYHERYRVTPEDRGGQVARMGFDASMLEIWPILTAGAALYLLETETLLAPDALQQWLVEQEITLIHLPPVIAEEQIQRAWPDTVKLRVLLTVSDRLQTCPAKPLPFACVNHYGPTEYSVICTSAEVPVQGEGVPAIGRPISNTQVYVLDAHLRPVPAGVVGEIHVSGAGIAKGYLNRPELTAEKFIDHPFLPGQKLYKTGDLGRLQADGTLEFVGRADDQVKLRGFRIQLGEVESVLVQHPTVQAAAAMVREDEPGHKRLVAYVIPLDKDKFQADELRAYLQQRVPEYMIPSAFVAMEAFPLNSNEKIDRKALPAPVEESRQEKAYAAPRTELERTLAGIWQEVLQIPSVGVYDNFFELGGDSILSIQIVSRAHRHDLRLTPKQLFQNLTIAALAKVVKEDRVVSDQGAATGEVRLTPIQRWFFDQSLPNPHHWNMPMLLDVHQPINLDWVKEALRHLVLHHDALRLRYEQTINGWRQWYDTAPPDVPLQEENLAGLSEDEQVSTMEGIANQVQASLDLHKGPLVRAVYFHRGPGKTDRLLIVVHHLVVDGVSWRILLEDFTTAYKQLEQGQPVQLLPKTSSFQEWANRLASYAQTQELKKEWTYWKQEALVSVLALPVDHQTGDNTDGSAAKVTVSLTREETRALLQDVPKAYHTQINDILLTALAEAYVVWSGNKLLRINLEGHGREEIIEGVDITRTVGWFTTVFPVLLEGTYQRPIQNGELLKAVKEKLRQIPKRGIGYGLMRYLHDDKEIAKMLSSAAQPQISFNYLGQFHQDNRQDQTFTMSVESAGEFLHSEGKRSYLLDIYGQVVDDRLEIHFEYSQHCHAEGTVKRLADEFAKALREWIQHCTSPGVQGFTPSDFPAANINQSDLNKLLSLLQKK